MLPRNHPDRIQVAFDDHRLVANAGLLLPATLALHLGLSQLVQQRLDLGDAPGRANTGDKIMTLVASALAGGDCIDDADALRAGGTAGVPRNHPDRIQVAFDDHRLVANAGLLLPATLALHLGLSQLVQQRLDLDCLGSRRHPHWALSCAAFAGATSANWTG